MFTVDFKKRTPLGIFCKPAEKLHPKNVSYDRPITNALEIHYAYYRSS